MVRLGVQGVELLETGRITLPIPEPWLSWIRELRVGKHTMAEALEIAQDLEDRLHLLTDASDLPEQPDHGAANRWLIGAYQAAWDDCSDPSGCLQAT
jgi:hypothetical protein